jgi:hypothetical protein
LPGATIVTLNSGLLGCAFTMVKGAIVEAANAKMRSTVKTLCIFRISPCCAVLFMTKSILNLSLPEKVLFLVLDCFVSGVGSEFEKA